MKRKFQLTALALLATTCVWAQSSTESEADSTIMTIDAGDFTISESQLGEDDDMTSDVIQVGSSNNLYTSNIGWTWSAARSEGVEMVMPGDNIEIEVKLISEIAMDKGLKLAIREGGRTVGAGFCFINKFGSHCYSLLNRSQIVINR